MAIDNRNQDSNRRLAWISLSAVAFLIAACGKSNPPAPPKAVITPPAQVAVPAAAPPKAKGDSPAPQRSTDSATVKSKPLPPGTDPFSVFEISAVNARTLVEPAKPNPDDQFEVESGQKGIDSTRFVVAAVPAAAAGPTRSSFALPSGFVPVPSAGYSSSGVPLRIRCEKTESLLALVPAGAGSVGSSDGPAESQPEFTVHLDTYYMEIFEVTVEEFEKFRTEMREKKKPVPTTLNGSASPRTPVLGVPWGVAQTFARWAGMELPTEAEFERAARGPNSLRTPWGDGREIWPTARTVNTITAVGSFPTDMSPYGIYDLAGNAREWCSDFYSDHAHRDAVGNGSIAPHNWPGPKKVSNVNLRTVKGNGPDWSAWHRQSRDIGKGFPDVGFRCVLRVPAADKAGT